MGKNVTVFKNFETPKDEGLYFRLLCLTGKAKGVSYFLMGNRIVLGRSDQTDIQVFDLKSSREHAEITRVGNDLVVTDLNSQNGITVNDLKIKQHRLKDGDKLIIGQTVYKFSQIKVSDPVKRKQQEIEQLKAEKESVEPVKKGKSPVLLIVIVIAGIGILFMENKPQEKRLDRTQKEQTNFKLQTISDDFADELVKKKAKEDKEVKEKLKIIYHRGLREYREGNFFRAIKEFNRALAIKPDDAQSQFYLRKVKGDLDHTIKQFQEKGDRDFNSLKFQGASISYCAIISLLHSYPEDERRVNAEKRIEEIEKNLGMEQGEIKCLEK
jgi:pSer/pThr/pTyr-binding forkhead associated (FHA) protein